MKLSEDRLNIACVLLRLGTGSVFLILGIDKILEPGNWVHFFPNEIAQWIHQFSGSSVFRLLWIQGAVECLLGVQVIAGFLTRISAAVCSVILLGIIVSLGIEDPVAVRDIGLLSGALGVLILGAGGWSADHLIKSWDLDKQ